MNIYVRILPLALLMLSNVVVAKAPVKEEKKVDAKCYVELVGGVETVSFWYIQPKKLPNLANSITGKKVMFGTSKQKVKIYKTHECVLLKDSFKGSRAKMVDEKTAR